MGIWDIVLPVANWNRNIIERIETGEKARPPQGAWPAKPRDLSEANWKKAKHELWALVEAVNNRIEQRPFQKIRLSPYG